MLLQVKSSSTHTFLPFITGLYSASETWELQTAQPLAGNEGQVNVQADALSAKFQDVGYLDSPKRKM